MLKNTTAQKIDELIERYPVLKECQAEITAATDIICDGYRRGGKLIICGNGGSAADAEHIVGELMKGFLLPRPISEEMRERLREVCPKEAAYISDNLQGALPALSLVNQVALNTAFANDQAPDLAFAQQILGMGRPEDVLLAISTSGNSTNVIYALQVARAKKMATVGLTGKKGGKLKELTDICLCVPEDATYRIQELHLPVYHTLCIAVENEFFG
ncbi:MAG: SIS domain-containing protein [Selenomonadaceae bacterium]|nr:SIS domain-containing protein [Selenomonadaceae bacterium]